MRKYFDGKVSPGFVSIYSSRMMMRIAAGLLGVFLPIFLYNVLDLNLTHVLFYYLADFLIYMLLVPAGARFALNKVGIKRAMVISTFFGALYYFAFFILDRGLNQGGEIFASREVLIILSLTLVLINTQRLIYWVPVHTSLAKFTDSKNRVKQMSLLEASTIIVGAVLPVIAGWVITNYNYDILFLITVFFYLSSVVPLMTMPPTGERYSWGYWRSWKELFSKDRRKALLAFAGDGAENVVGTVIWPIFIWELLKGDYLQVGILSSLIVLVSAGLQLFVGRVADFGNNNKKVLRLGTILYAIGWIVKMFIATAFQIFVASTYHNLAKIFTRAPFDALIYQRAADQGHFVDEYTVIHEMALMIGRVLIIVAMLALIPILGVKWTFLMAAFSSLLMNLFVDDNWLIARVNYGER